jgi:hypothetical protein
MASFLGVAAAPACGSGFTAVPGEGGVTDGGPLDSPTESEATPSDAPDTGSSCAPLPGVPNPETCVQNGVCNVVMVAAGSTSMADQKFPFGIASGTDGYVYWAAQDDIMGFGTQGAIWRARKPSSGPLRVVKATAPTAIAVDTTRVYWIDNGSMPSTLYTAPLDCNDACTATTIGSSGGLRVIRVVGDGDVFASGDSEVWHYVYSNSQWISRLVAPVGVGSLLAYDGLAVFLSSMGVIRRLSVDGTMVAPFATGDGTPYAAIDSDCMAVFAATASGVPQIRVFPLPSGPPNAVPEPLLGTSVNASAIDRQYLYYGLLNSGGVVRVRRSGMSSQVIAPAFNAWGVAVDETSLYFVDQLPAGGGSIYRVVK